MNRNDGASACGEPIAIPHPGLSEAIRGAIFGSGIDRIAFAKRPVFSILARFLEQRVRATAVRPRLYDKDPDLSTRAAPSQGVLP